MNTRKHIADVLESLEKKANEQGTSIADVLVHAAKSMGVQLAVSDDDRYEIDPQEAALRAADAEANARAEAEKAATRARLATEEAQRLQAEADKAAAKAQDTAKAAEVE